MKRNIITTITFSNKKISISAIEKLENNIVEIFNANSEITKKHTFISSSILHIEKIIGGKISKATFVIEPNEKVQSNIKLSKDEFPILGNSVTKIDIENSLNIIKNKNTSEDRRVTLVQPIEFRVTDTMTKSYSSAPIHKPGNLLTIISTITTISKNVYEYIYNTAKNADVEIAEILLTGQTESLANLSQLALSNGSVLIHIGEEQTNLMINKNNSVVSMLPIYHMGYKDLIKGIMKKFKCEKNIAIDLFNAHATLLDDKIKVIHTSQIGAENWTFTNKDLEEVLIRYFDALNAIAKKYLSQKKIEGLPIIYSGKLNKIKNLEDYIRNEMVPEKATLHNPLTFIEMNCENVNSLGTLNFIKIMDEVQGKQYDTIVNTNPNTLNSIRMNNIIQKNWFEKLKTKIGGKYDWK